jgi:hypothetical protein
MLLCLLPIKPLSDFCCNLEVIQSISHFLQSQINNHHATLYYFCRVTFLLSVSLVLTVDKVMIRFPNSMKCHTKHYSLLAVKAVLFSHYIHFFPGCIFIDISLFLKTVILQAIARA